LYWFQINAAKSEHEGQMSKIVAEEGKAAGLPPSDANVFY
jgi:hypothetical protein